jgi:hypothetical protein
MWITKFSLITFLFFAMILFAAYLMSQVTGELLFEGWTRDALEQLTGKNDIDVDANPTLVFGDYIATSQAVGTLLLQTGTGGVVSDVMQGLPYFNNDALQLIVRFLYTFSLAFLILAIIGRVEF